MPTPSAETQGLVVTPLLHGLGRVYPDLPNPESIDGRHRHSPGIACVRVASCSFVTASARVYIQLGIGVSRQNCPDGCGTCAGGV